MSARRDGNNLIVSVYRKATHTDQYLNYSSHHPLEHKLSVVRTLTHRVDTIVTTEGDKTDEKKHLSTALKQCGYPEWVIKKGMEQKDQSREPPGNEKENSRQKGMVILPYIKGLGEKLRRIFKKSGINTVFRPHKTIKKILRSPKDKTDKMDKTGVIYHLKCDDCGEDYIGETERKIRDRFPEHRRKSSIKTSAMAHHLHYNNHKLTERNCKILDRESDWRKRGIKEAIYIRKNAPTLNRDEDRHQLTGTWDNLLGGHDIRPPMMHH